MQNEEKRNDEMGLKLSFRKWLEKSIKRNAPLNLTVSYLMDCRADLSLYPFSIVSRVSFQAFRLSSLSPHAQVFDAFYGKWINKSIRDNLIIIYNQPVLFIPLSSSSTISHPPRQNGNAIYLFITFAEMQGQYFPSRWVSWPLHRASRVDSIMMTDHKYLLFCHIRQQ